MRLFTTLALFLSALPACVYYDGGCSGDDCADPFGDWEDPSTDGAGDEDPSDPTDPDIDNLTLEFFPATAEAGEVFLASIVVSEGQADLSTVSGLRFYGEVELLVWGARANEVTATVSVPPDAASAEVDVVVEFADGSAELLPAALSIYPAGSGNSADDWQNGGPVGGECE